MQPYRLCHLERLILDLYCAETIAEGPGSLTLRKISAPFGLAELPKARVCFDALVGLMPSR